MLIETPPRATRRPVPRWIWITAVAACILVIAGAILAAAHWPFTREAIAQALAESSGTNVNIGTFHRTYFPPGCVARDLRFRRNGKTVITIRELIVVGSYHGM